MARGVVVDDDGFWNMGSMGLFAMLAQPPPKVGDSSSRHHYRNAANGKQGYPRPKKSVSVGGKTKARWEYIAWRSTVSRFAT